MNVYVCVKQVPDTETRIVLKDNSRIDESNIKWIVSPYDEFAIEEAVRLKEKQAECNVIAVTLGPERAQEAIRMALAMGADRAIHIVSDAYLDANLVAKALANAIKNDDAYDVIFTGKQAIDDDGYQVHVRLAHFLRASVATHIVTFELMNNYARVAREIDEGALEKLEIALPAVIAVSKGINTPRYPTLPNIMKAKKKQIKKLTLSDAGMAAIANRQEVILFSIPPIKSQGKVLKGTIQETVPSLVALLREEAKVI